MDNNPIISLCVPTNGIVEWVIPLINSIYSQGVDLSQFEVIITDNGRQTDLAQAVKRFSYSNLYYHRTTSTGFTNQIDSFKLAHGEFRKMLNHRSILLPGALKSLIKLVNENLNVRPIIYCAERGEGLSICNNIDAFVASLRCTVSWSAGVGIWKDDIPALEKAEINELFPHMSLLFEIRENPQFLIWNTRYERQTKESGKGGYNPFYAFGVEFLDIVNRLRLHGMLSLDTFLLVKYDTYIRLKYFYIEDVLAYRSRNSFMFDNIKKHILVYYDIYSYYKMVIWAWCQYPKYKIVSLLKR